MALYFVSMTQMISISFGTAILFSLAALMAANA
jgi:hypothetical protein